jgi:RNA polymerase sigma-70 factor (ECF subfamily)
MTIALKDERPREAQARRTSAGFDDFMREQSPRLLQSLSLILRDRELAADVAQDTFVQLHLHWDEIGEIKNPTAWLYRVAINRSRDYRRRLARHLRLIERLGRLSLQEDWVSPATRGTEFVSVLGSLPERQRTAATLYYLADFSVAETARVMNISEGTVSQHLNRARESLRRTLEVD